MLTQSALLPAAPTSSVGPVLPARIHARPSVCSYTRVHTCARDLLRVNLAASSAAVRLLVGFKFRVIAASNMHEPRERIDLQCIIVS